MKKTLQILVIGILLLGCKEKPSDKKEIQEEIIFNQDLVNELERMVKIDQIAASVPQGKYKKLTLKQWNSFKDSVFTTHQKKLKQIFNTYGFVGFDLAGENGSKNFWLMVQHSDHNPDFQLEVLKKMKLEVDKKNANPSNYGYLVDRVYLNTGKKQVFGTQATYNTKTGQAYPKNLSDSLNVNQRRKALGLKPLEMYLNDLTKMHFEMNQEYYRKKGIVKPKLY
ncbi:DUF6624 domain-containing protein [Tenacibaculum xiamenense]|uniref:DUF6624 domain-containing protein n=1 Tax=Tenacibaculum xiamenense TaxID=1261553 RepID=UPI00389537FB